MSQNCYMEPVEVKVAGEVTHGSAESSGLGLSGSDVSNRESPLSPGEVDNNIYATIDSVIQPPPRHNPYNNQCLLSDSPLEEDILDLYDNAVCVPGMVIDTDTSDEERENPTQESTVGNNPNRHKMNSGSACNGQCGAIESTSHDEESHFRITQGHNIVISDENTHGSASEENQYSSVIKRKNNSPNANSHFADVNNHDVSYSTVIAHNNVVNDDTNKYSKVIRKTNPPRKVVIVAEAQPRRNGSGENTSLKSPHKSRGSAGLPQIPTYSSHFIEQALKRSQAASAKASQESPKAKSLNGPPFQYIDTHL